MFRMDCAKLFAAAFLMTACIFVATDALAVMSVDLGSEYMKIAIVKPGVPMEIALNKDSRRKTPVMVTMKDGERLFGEAALSKAVRYPKAAYWFLHDLVAKDSQNPLVKSLQKKFPYYDIIEDEETNNVLFRHDEDTTYSPEELLAMILEMAKETAETFAEQAITDAVITVPPYFHQAERRALLRAAELAGIKVLQLMNDNAAVALNYGIFRRKEFNNSAVHYMFFDMGSTGTTATVVAYQEVKQKNAVTGIVDKFPQLTIKGVGFDRMLGGMEMQLRLRDHLAKIFNEQKKTDNDVFESPRAMAKLLKEAGRVKQVLSANNDHFAQVEGLLDDKDFKAKVTRAEYEEMCKDILDRIPKVVKDALSTSEVTLDEIQEVILMGGSTRMPKAQEILQKAVGREELGKSINTDEAAALGAVYQAAHLSKGFRVKKFAVKDACMYPIQVEFERVKASEGGDEAMKIVKRTLFGRMNPYPQKKVMTFNRHTKDFGFQVNYGDLDFLTPEETSVFGRTTLYETSLVGVGKVHDEHAEGAESKGVKAHFRMDDSGILTLDRVESVFEKAPPPVEDGASEDGQSTFSKLGSTISNLFGGGDIDKQAEKETNVEEDNREEPPAEGEQKPETEEEQDQEEGSDAADEAKEPAEEKAKDEDGETQEEQTDEKQEEQEKEEEKEQEREGEEEAEKGEEEAEKGEEEAEKEQDSEQEEKSRTEEKEGVISDSTDNEEKKDEKEKEKEEKKEEEKEEKKEEGDEKKANGEKKEEKEEKPKEMKPITIKEEIEFQSTIKDISEPSEDSMLASKNKIQELTEKDKEREKLAQATNDLETFIIDGQDKMYQEIYEKCSTEEERESIRQQFSQASDWLYEQDETTERKVYEDKLKELKKLTRDIYERVKELEERPKAIEALNSIVNYSEHFLVGMKNFTGDDQPFTEIEYTTLDSLIFDTKDWNKTIMADQAKTPDYEKPKVTTEDFARKINDLDREIKYLVGKAKSFRPKTKPKEEEMDTNKTKKKTKPKEKEEEEDDDDVEIAEENGEEQEGTQSEFEIPPQQSEEEQKQEKQAEDVETQEQEPLELGSDVPSDSTTSASSQQGHGHDPDDEL